MGILERALNAGEGKKFKAYERRVERINAFEPELELETDEELRERFDELRQEAVDGPRPRRPSCPRSSPSRARSASAR